MSSDGAVRVCVVRGGEEEVTHRDGQGNVIKGRKPFVKADTDDRILIETNMPIRSFVSHIHSPG